MPTENRSSNTEQMVRTPVALLERIRQRLIDTNQISDFGPELWSLLNRDQPAAQHQGEPVFMVRSHGSCCWEESNGEGLDIALSMPDEYEVRKLYLHPPTSDGFSAGDMADQGAKAFRDGQRPITELTDDLREILGRPNFTCHYIAQALRQMGRTIAKKSEDEQASVIHWMLGHYLKHGPDWRQHASDELKAASQAAE